MSVPFHSELDALTNQMKSASSPPQFDAARKAISARLSQMTAEEKEQLRDWVARWPERARHAEAKPELLEFFLPPLVDDLDPATTRVLGELMAERQFGVTEDFADLLGSIGPLAAFAIPSLDRVLSEFGSEEDYSIRTKVAFALGETASAEAIPPLMRALSDEAPQVRWSAILSLAKLNAQSAAPQILHLLRTDDNQMVRASAASALGDLRYLPAKNDLSRLLEENPGPDLERTSLSALDKLSNAP